MEKYNLSVKKVVKNSQKNQKLKLQASVPISISLCSLATHMYR